MKVAVIPARGGSKRIPRKNIRLFAGRPIIAFPIAAAVESSLFDHVIVSTDDPEIAEIAASNGASVPFTRPAELSDDHATTTEVMAHATRWMLGEQWPLQAVCCLYATAPFVQADDLRRGLDALKTGPWAYAFSATEYAAPVHRSFRMHADGGVEMFFPDKFDARSQDLPIALHDAAQFYWGRPESWLAGKHIFDRHSFPVVLPRWRVQDMDTEEDWRRAELLWEILRQKQT